MPISLLPPRARLGALLPPARNVVKDAKGRTLKDKDGGGATTYAAVYFRPAVCDFSHLFLPETFYRFFMPRRKNGRESRTRNSRRTSSPREGFRRVIERLISTISDIVLDGRYYSLSQLSVRRRNKRRARKQEARVSSTLTKALLISVICEVSGNRLNRSRCSIMKFDEAYSAGKREKLHRNICMER